MSITHFYRYRSIESLLGPHNELKRQSIFFASPEELNDPMEGFQDVYWDGDIVLWKNLFRHYVRSIMITWSLIAVVGDGFEERTIQSALRISHANLPSEELKSLSDEIFKAFYDDNDVRDCLVLIASIKRKIRRDELNFYIGLLHGPVVYHTARAIGARGLGPPVGDMPDTLRNSSPAKKLAIALKAASELNLTEAQMISGMFEVGNRSVYQLALLHLVNEMRDLSDARKFLILEFPDFYCRHVPEILYPGWYAACFVADPTQAAMWGHYGKGHTGVCLKFSAEIDQSGCPEIELSQAPSPSGDDGDSHKQPRSQAFQFETVSYANEFPDVDFFGSLGRYSLPVLEREWFSESDRQSERDRSFLHDANWRAAYWKNFRQTCATKLDDWSYEKEWRLTLTSALQDVIEREDRTFNYAFKSLAGLIFGINTTTKDKIRLCK